MIIFLKILPALIFWGIFIYVILNVPYPQSITQATPLQLFLFFITLFLALTLTLNIFLRSTLVSSSIVLGIIFILILKALNSLSLITTLLVIVAVALLISYFRKIKEKGIKKILFSGAQIPKLNLSNRFKQVKLTYSRRRKR